MRKILSVVLAVVMLAAMFVMPTNAAEEMGLVITEINVDSSYIGKDGSFFRGRKDACCRTVLSSEFGFVDMVRYLDPYREIRSGYL